MSVLSKVLAVVQTVSSKVLSLSSPLALLVGFVAGHLLHPVTSVVVGLALNLVHLVLSYL